LQEGIDKFFEAAQAAKAALEEATPLLEEATALTKEITPLLQVCSAKQHDRVTGHSCCAIEFKPLLVLGGLMTDLEHLSLFLVLPHSAGSASPLI
jgi:hypothetical protein